MKYIKQYSTFLNESINEQELNNILDKINKSGLESLDVIELKMLKNYGNNNFNIKDDVINDIKHLIGDNYLTMGELEAESSPVYKSIDQEIHLVERLSEDVGVVSYGGYKYDTELDEYDVEYSELDLDTLIQIKELLENALEYGLLETKQ